MDDDEKEGEAEEEKNEGNVDEKGEKVQGDNKEIRVK